MHDQVKCALTLLARVREVGEQGHPRTCGAQVVNIQHVHMYWECVHTYIHIYSLISSLRYIAVPLTLPYTCMLDIAE